MTFTKIYSGTPPGDVNVTVGNARWSLKLRRDLRDHACDLAWGYGGSGPSQLALAMLCDALKDDERALRLYQQFKWAYIALLPKDCPWQLTLNQIKDWVAKHDPDPPSAGVVLGAAMRDQAVDERGAA